MAMRHLKSGRILGRNSAHRTAMFRNMTCALIAKERITTTVAKAKELRPFVEKLVTLAKKGTLHSRRLVIARLGNQKASAKKLVDEIAPRFKDRAGGYTRIIKSSYRRLGDAAPTAFIEFLKAGETKEQVKAPVKPKVAE
jgi:large subunit ribosomal protein L17